MKRWTETTLGDVLTLQRGFDLPERMREDGPIPIVSSSGVSGYHSSFKVKAPGVVTGRYGTLGEVFYVCENSWPLNTTLWVKDFKGNHPRFISYLLQTLNFARQNAAGAVPGVNRNALHMLPVRTPPPPVQERIASILSAYDDLIANNIRRIKVLEEMTQKLYREWFVSFRFPGHEKVPMVESEIGPIPKGWLRPYPECVDFLEGPGLRRWQYREKGLPFLNIRTILDNDIDLGKTQFLDPEEVESKYRHFLLAEWDHVVSSSGTLGRIATVRRQHLPVMLNTSIIRMRPKTTAVGRWQLKHFLKSDYFQRQIRAFAIGAAQPNFGPSHLKQARIVAPPDETGRSYESIVEPMELMVHNLTQKNTNLRTTRAFLLPKLISGEVSVENLAGCGKTTSF